MPLPALPSIPGSRRRAGYIRVNGLVVPAILGGLAPTCYIALDMIIYCIDGQWWRQAGGRHPVRCNVEHSIGAVFL